jgi:hypothetical protein
LRQLTLYGHGGTADDFNSITDAGLLAVNLQRTESLVLWKCNRLTAAGVIGFVKVGSSKNDLLK